MNYGLLAIVFAVVAVLCILGALAFGRMGGGN